MSANPGEGQTEPEGGPVRHIPVLLHQVVEALQPLPGKVILDGTFGAGGYSSALLAAGADVIGLDRDPSAIANGQALVAAHAGRLSLIHSQFSQLADHAPEGGLDGVVLDIGRCCRCATRFNVSDWRVSASRMSTIIDSNTRFLLARAIAV